MREWTEPQRPDGRGAVTGRRQTVFLPDRLSVVRRQQSPCGCIVGVDKISGYAVIERECPKAAQR